MIPLAGAKFLPQGSPQDLQNWLSHNQALRADICDQLLAYHEGDNTKDVTMLKSMRYVDASHAGPPY